jgi:hypothetical protein
MGERGKGSEREKGGVSEKWGEVRSEGTSEEK